MKKIIAILLAAVALTGCVHQQYKPTKSALELQSIQTKEFETNKKIGFAATLSVFQDLGYVVNSASLETGLINAKSPTSNEMIPFVGQVMKDVKATAFVEEIAPNRTKVRLNFVNSTQSSSGYGMKGESDMPIEDGAFYQDVFTKIQQGIFIRKNVN
jgi:PBP1b-binding outer membrane lipoprotein LpoB